MSYRQVAFMMDWCKMMGLQPVHEWVWGRAEAAWIQATTTAGSRKPMSSVKVRINEGTTVSMDFGVSNWPHLPGGMADVDMVFEANWNGKWWDCRADGYGNPGKYGSGSIYVHSLDGVRSVDDFAGDPFHQATNPTPLSSKTIAL
jgi:hypothetical protein